MGDQQQAVKLHGIRHSPFSVRVEIALKMKGVDYEFIDEDIQNKSEELLKYNPIHKKIPVLVHAGKPVVESLVILEYIDETWKGVSIADDLLPSDPYDRAQARFWAKFIDDKLMTVYRDALLGEGEVAEKAAKETLELFQFLEKEINGKKFFGGNRIGFLDIAGLIVAYWGPIFQEAADKELFTSEKYPAISAWTDQLLACDVVKESVPNREEMVAVLRARLPALRAHVPK